MNSIDIKNFYNSNQFPGHYTAQGLLYHNEQIKNLYLKIKFSKWIKSWFRTKLVFLRQS